ncbi:MAG: DUF883 C-terminal domain-containing protein [Ferruginibacter sp.]
MQPSKIENTNDLRSAIAALELRKDSDELALKEEFNDTLTSLKPVNLLKSTVGDFVHDNHWRSKIVNTAVGLGIGYLSKATVVGRGASLGKKIFGVLVQFGVTNVVVKNAEKIKDAGANLLKKIF